MTRTPEVRVWFMGCPMDVAAEHAALLGLTAGQEIDAMTRARLVGMAADVRFERAPRETVDAAPATGLRALRARFFGT